MGTELIEARSPSEVEQVVRLLQQFRAAGYVLFPLAVATKVPRDTGWRHRDYSNFDVARWLRIGGNVGVRLGPRDVVLDVDPRNFEPGDNPLARLADAVGLELATLPSVLTGAGGQHLYLRLDADEHLAGKVEGFAGIDVKKHGGFVAAPGSMHPDTGETYRMAPDSPAIGDAPIAPAGLLALLRREAPAERTIGSGVISANDLKRLLDVLDATEYHQYDRWMVLMAAAADATGGDPEAEQAFIDWSKTDPAFAHESDETLRYKWQSFRAGRDGGATVWTLLREVRDAGHGELAEEFEASIAYQRAQDWFEAVEPEEVVQKEERPHRWKLWEVSELERLPPIRYLVQRMLPERGLVQIYGPTKNHKSFVALDMTLCIATGKDFHGVKVRRARVCYVIAEGQSDVINRIQAWCVANGVSIEDLRGWFRVVISPIMVDKREQAIEFCKYVAATGPVDLLVLDTLNRNMEGNESDTFEMSKFVRGCDAIRARLRCAVMPIHHTGWDKMRARGSSALLAAVDASIQVKLVDETKGRETRLWVEHIRTAEPDAKLYFTPETVVLGENSDGDIISSIIMRQIEPPADQPKRSKDDKLAQAERNRMDLLVEIYHGRPVKQVELIREGRVQQTISKYVAKLREDGLLELGTLALTPKGIDEVENMLKRRKADAALAAELEEDEVTDAGA